jgi:hypothetical protein
MFRTNFEERNETHISRQICRRSYNLRNLTDIRFPDGVKLFPFYTEFRSALEPAHWGEEGLGCESYNFQLVRGATPPLPHTSSWRCSRTNTGTSLPSLIYTFTANVYGVTSGHVIAYPLHAGGKVARVCVTLQN